MTQSELKELTNLGAELGAAKAEIEALREQVKVLQSDANSWQSGYDKGRNDGAKHRKSEVEQLRQHKNEYMDAAEVTRKALLAEIESLRNGLKNARYRIEQGRVWNGMGWTLTGLHAHQQQKALDEIDAALSQQAEPTDTFTAVDMATAAAQGFRDGRAAVEQAAAQDEREAVKQAIAEALGEALDCTRVWSAWSYGTMGPNDFQLVAEDDGRLDEIADAAISAMTTRPAQAEQQPVGWIHEDELPEGYPYDAMFPFSKVDVVRMFPVYAPIAQTAKRDLLLAALERTVDYHVPGINPLSDAANLSAMGVIAKVKGQQDEQPAVFWVLFDATGPERFIKKDVSDGTLAFFDSEDEAQRAKRRHPGTDYKRVEYYRAPIAQTEQQPDGHIEDMRAMVEQASAQYERDFNPDHTLFSEIRCSMPVNDDGEETRYIINEQQLQRIRALEFNRPAQTEQQPAVPAGFVLLPLEPTEAILDALHSGGYVGDDKELRELYQSLLDAAPIAQTAPQGKFRMGDLVKKSTGSEWVGRVVGWYSTEQTKEGYAVESSAHRNSVQIYPAKALEAV